jgi:hypothetical protein
VAVDAGVEGFEALTEEDRRRKAEQASVLTLLSVVLCLMMNCGCITVFLAVPTSMWALHLSRVALGTEDPSEVVKAYATPARNISLITFLFSGLASLAILLYFGTYFGFIALMMGIAILNP